MPRYFFNIFHDPPYVDDEGMEFVDKHAAWQEATRMAGEMIKDIDGKLRPGHDWSLEVRDEFANVLYRLHVSVAKPK